MECYKMGERMSKILFLRGAVPTDRDPKQIMFDNIDECDDMWTQLCRNMIDIVGGSGEIWYLNGKRTVKYADNFVERWLPNFTDSRHDFNPDIIFARGGFPFYDDVLRRHPNAFKIYYGAGFRRIPGKKQFRDFDLILVDTPKQLVKAKAELPKHNIQLLIKPAADNIFSPAKYKCSKQYDVIMVGNYHKGVNKGHDFALPLLHEKFTMTVVGNIPEPLRNKYKRFSYKQWVPRKDIPRCYAPAKVAIICCGKEDSCPRVIPEALACDCPILSLSRVNFWKDKYINDQTGMVTSKEDFIKNLYHMVKHYEDFSPYTFYNNNLSLKVSAQEIIGYAS